MLSSEASSEETYLAWTKSRILGKGGDCLEHLFSQVGGLIIPGLAPFVRASLSDLVVPGCEGVEDLPEIPLG